MTVLLWKKFINPDFRNGWVHIKGIGQSPNGLITSFWVQSADAKCPVRNKKGFQRRCHQRFGHKEATDHPISLMFPPLFHRIQIARLRLLRESHGRAPWVLQGWSSLQKEAEMHTPTQIDAHGESRGLPHVRELT